MHALCNITVTDSVAFSLIYVEKVEVPIFIRGSLISWENGDPILI